MDQVYLEHQENHFVEICDSKTLEKRLREKCWNHINGYSTLDFRKDLEKEAHRLNALQCYVSNHEKLAVPSLEEVHKFLGGLGISEQYHFLIATFFDLASVNQTR